MYEKRRKINRNHIAVLSLLLLCEYYTAWWVYHIRTTIVYSFMTRTENERERARNGKSKTRNVIALLMNTKHNDAQNVRFCIFIVSLKRKSHQIDSIVDCTVLIKGVDKMKNTKQNEQIDRKNVHFF